MNRDQAMQNSNQNGESGYTLVEVMIAVLITFIVMAGVYRTIGDEKINMERQEKSVDALLNAQMAINTIGSDIRRAGFLGCGGESTANTLDNSGTDKTWLEKFTLADTSIGGEDWTGTKTILEELKRKVGGFEYLGDSWAVSNDNTAAALYEPGTDAISLVFLGQERSLASAMTAGTDDISLDAEDYDEGDILYITDCENHALFQKTNPPAATVKHEISMDQPNGMINSADDLKYNFGQFFPATVYRLDVATYFVEAGTMELCRGSSSRPIASNIEDLQFEFLVASSSGSLVGASWQDGLGVGEAERLRAVRIWVLAVSDVDYSYTDNNTYDYPNSPYYTPDNTFVDSKGNPKPINPFHSDRNLTGGSPASQAPLPGDGEHRHRYLNSEIIYLRNADLL